MAIIDSLRAAVLSCSLVFIVAGCGVRSPHEGVYVSPGVVELGELKDQSLLRAEFRIVNSTTASVTIVDSKVSCGCSKLTLANSVIPPGDSVVASLDADIAGRHGEQSFEAVLYTDRAASPEIRLVARALLTSTQPVSGYHQIGKCVAKQLVSTTVVVRKEGSSGVQTVTGGSDVKLSEIRDGGDVWLCSVRFSAPELTGAFEKTLVLSSLGKAAWKQQSISLRGVVVSRWQIPDSISLGFLKPNEPVTKTVLVRDTLQGTEIGRKNPIRSIQVARTADSHSVECVFPEHGAHGEMIVRFLGTADTGAIAKQIDVAITTDLGTDVLPVRIAGHVLAE